MLLAVAFVPVAVAREKENLKIEVVSDNTREYEAGAHFSLAGTKTRDVVFGVNAIINGEHAKLTCMENHHGCTAVGPGTYDAAFDGKNTLWIISSQALTHKVIRDHYKLAGSW
jgi:hypothetical protein